MISIAVGGLHFPECLRWYENRLFFSDMYGDAVLAFDPESGELETVAEVFHPGGIGWLPDGRMLAVASEDKTILEVGNGGNRLYADLGHTSPGFLNDMLVDRTGRIYAGNFGYDLFNDEPCPTQLIVVDIDGKAALQADDVVFPNGIVKRSDGKLVVAESFGKCLTTFSVDDDGSVWRESSISLGELVPDGICIDAEDHVWISSVYTDEVVRVGRAGEMERHPVGQAAFACMLGGADGRTLFVATAPDFEPDARRARAEGRIETLRVEVPGVGGQGLGA
ncbi:MAG TPA: SMP-30/gluconolactonase/LRE family protein [Thermoleophilaceae bacterium]|nr:SMP-30/gluconolactonase/LRE family protein [Thermoleophilaceae bacterium]